MLTCLSRLGRCMYKNPRNFNFLNFHFLNHKFKIDAMNSSLLNRILSPLASAPRSYQTSNKNNDDDDEPLSSFQRTVCLYDWWLVKADKGFQGKRLAVAGFTSRELRAMRVFNSAPIVKRYDVFTLETADGVCIIVKGFINKARTIENGFSSKVFSHFVFGFPAYWEAYSEKCLEEECTTGAAVEGKTNCSTNTSPSKVNGRNEHYVEDMCQCSENAFESTESEAFTDSAESNQVAENNDIDKAENHAPDTSLNILEQHLVTPAECSTGLATRFSEKMAVSRDGSPENIFIDNANDHTLDNCVLATECDTREENLEEPAEPSTFHVISFKKMVNVKGTEKGNGRLEKRPNSKMQENMENNMIASSESGKFSMPNDKDYESLNIPDLGASNENLSAETRITSNLPETSERTAENGKNKDVLNSENRNVFPISLPQGSEAVPRCTGEKESAVQSENLFSSGPGSMHKESLTTQNIDIQLEIGAVSTHWNRIIRNCLGVGQNHQEESPRSKGSFKSKNMKLLRGFEFSTRENIKQCSSYMSTRSRRKIDKSVSSPRKLSTDFEKSMGNTTGKEKAKGITCGLKATRKQVSDPLVSRQTTNIVQNKSPQGIKISNLPDGECQEPTDEVANDNSKDKRHSRRTSQTPSLTQNLHKCNLKAAVSEKEMNAPKEGSTRNEARRKINFDKYASPCTRGRREKPSVISPETLSLKRSRSGRLLLPSLDFWRNQIAVYDADRKVTGIQDLNILETPKVSKSEPKMKRRK